ncbi:MAG: hypothetical protein RLY49_314 [Candidatus Parcubacteria bacterium]|jgi:hypothetical protein
MKSIRILLALILSAILASATDFGAGPSVIARAYEDVRSGQYSVTGDGLKGGFGNIFQYPSVGVKNSDELRAPLRGITYLLTFENYKAYVNETVTLWNKAGVPVFVSRNSWRPEEHMSSDGKALSYTIPGNAGNIYLELADREIPCDSEYVEVQMEGGYYISLEMHDGLVVIPGWIYQSNGVFIEWKNGRRTVTDIQTGLPVVGGKDFFQTTQEGGVQGITVRNPSGLYLSIYGDSGWDTIFEVPTQSTGNFNLWVGDRWGNQPVGVYITNVGSKLPAVYYQTDKSGMIYFPVKKGETYHIQLYWNTSIGKG